jgi:hypothetical protein
MRMAVRRRDWDACEVDLDTPSIPYGSSDAFYEDLRENAPQLLAPERDIVLLEGAPAWTRDTLRDPGRDSCHHCGDAIGPGSLLYCPACHASGFDTRLDLQKGRAGIPPAEPSKKAPETAASRARKRSRKLTRKERRAVRFAQAQAGSLPAS